MTQFVPINGKMFNINHIRHYTARTDGTVHVMQEREASETILKGDDATAFLAVVNPSANSAARSEAKPDRPQAGPERQAAAVAPPAK